MNINPSIFIRKGLILSFLLLFSFQACASERQSETLNTDDDLECIAAKNGKLNIEKLTAYPASKNSFLFDCAVSVMVPRPKDTKAIRKKLHDNKQRIAEYLLTRELDVKHINQHGSTILMSVVISYLSKEWKQKTVKILIKKGVDVKHANQYKKTAVDFAKQKKDSELVKLLEN